MTEITELAEKEFAEVVKAVGNHSGFENDVVKGAYINAINTIFEHIKLSQMDPGSTEESQLAAVAQFSVPMQIVEDSLRELMSKGKDAYIHFCRDRLENIEDNIFRVILLRKAFDTMANGLGFTIPFQGGRSRENTSSSRDV